MPFLSPGDPPDPGIEHRSPTLQADSLRSELLGVRGLRAQTLEDPSPGLSNSFKSQSLAAVPSQSPGIFLQVQEEIIIQAAFFRDNLVLTLHVFHTFQTKNI